MATIADELNAISVEHGYTGAAPKTIAGAIDALADTLAGTDVEERRTIAGAVKALAPYIGSGGGGVALGGKQYTPTYTSQLPAVGDNLDNTSEFYVKSLYVGDQQVLFPDENDQAQIYTYNTVIALAAGSKATLVTHADESPETTAYVIKIGSRPTDLGSEDFFESVEPWDGEYTESYDDQRFFLSLTVTIPELDYAGGEMLLFYIAEG